MANTLKNLKEEYGEVGPLEKDYNVEPQADKDGMVKDGSVNSLPARKLVPANKKSLVVGDGHKTTIKEL